MVCWSSNCFGSHRNWALITQPSHPLIGWPFIFAAIVAAVTTVLSAERQHKITFQSPVVFGDSAPDKASFVWNPVVSMVFAACELVAIGFILGAFYHVFTIREPTVSPSSQYQMERAKQRRAERQIPAPYSDDDRAILVRELTPGYRAADYRFLIVREDDDASMRFADSLADILRRSHWTEVEPITSPAPSTQLPLGITIRCGTVEPASLAGYKLKVTLREVGTFCDLDSNPALRRYDYVTNYISDHGYLPKE